MQDVVKSIVKHFHLEGTLSEVMPLAQGHINNTYILARVKNKRVVRYILQRINHAVFKNPPAMMANILRVTEHIHSKMQRIDPELASRQLRVVRTDNGTSYYRDPEGNYWRVYNFVEQAVTYDAVESAGLAYEAARMFGWFQRMLNDLPGPVLHETIPNFHNTRIRFERFQEVLKKDPVNLAKGARPEIDFVLGHAGLCDVLPNSVLKGDVPCRIAHNDAKINNVMLDEQTHQGICVIDLDTVMPGLSVYDFADLVRTAATRAREDERDVSKVKIEMNLFEALVRGFAEQTHSFLTSAERSHLAFAGKLITFEQCIRFLTDHLLGDVYYKISRAGHNLDRCRTQIQLVRSIIEQEASMNEIVEKVFQENVDQQ
ncbi:MAG: aminoglycoside phosphotransferase family protein [Phycisphaerales bacterium]|nr:MAG: aminoglycoside phosphotransferase family protein [Phycisphaerales bacterium]